MTSIPTKTSGRSSHRPIRRILLTRTHTGFGPVVIGAAANHGNAAIAARLELPYTQSFATLRTSAALEGLYSADLGRVFTLHGRLTALGMFASSEAGDTHRLGFRAGADLVWQLLHASLSR